jgi:kynurenine formamidase
MSLRLVDLTTTLDPANRERMPAHLQGMAGIISPKVKYLAPDSDEGRDRMCAFFGCSHGDLRDGEGWGAEVLTEMSSHCGTHVDAPLHSGSTSEGKPARTVDMIDLNELFCPGMVLDVREWAMPNQAISVEALERAIRATGRKIRKGDAVLLRTGQERYTMADELFFMYPGMSREGTLFLSEQGATVLGTDAMAWDRPFKAMALAWRETGDNRHLWDGHKAIREREAFIIQQLTNLAALPPTGFQVGFFPIKLKAASAAPARVVAFLPD